MEERKLALVETEPIIEIIHLNKSFGTVQALHNVNLKIPEGRIIGLLGANGSGKTTLLKILAGFYADYEGEVLIDGCRPSAESKAKIAYLPDRDGLPTDMKVKDMIKIYKTFFNDFEEEKCHMLLDRFNISVDSTTEEMSKGVIEKLQISLLMARNARLYLLDEPIGGVDIEARQYILDLILENFNPKGTMIITTHLIREIERLFDSVIVLNKGEVVAFEESDTLRAWQGSNLEEALKILFRQKKAP